MDRLDYALDMLRHVVLLTFSSEATDSDIAAIIEGLEGLPAVIPEILAYSVGRDAGIADGNASFAVVGEFADAAAYQVYADHPVHRQVITERIVPLLEGRAAVQYEF